MTRIDEQLYDRIAEEELAELERALEGVDPDELEVELSMGVLTLTLAGGEKIVINSHRAAGQIWMAAFRRAWHFDPHRPEASGGRWSWRTGRDELRATLGGLLGEKLGRPVPL